MAIQAVKGTRDLYPEDYAPIRHIFDVWRDVSLRHGFEEFEGPTLEMLELYREKSGDELVGQLYRLTDSGGRELALRPEMTPTLARMVAARINTLPKPIKWFCIPTLFRGENVQRGRLREFFQWNVDIIGSDNEIADAECMLVGIEALRELGLTENDFVVKISSRRLIAAMLEALGISLSSHAAAYALLDKMGKMRQEDLAKRWDESFGSQIPFAKLESLLSKSTVGELGSALREMNAYPDVVATAFSSLGKVFDALRSFGAESFCRFDLRIVRGLAYYTGTVFEFYDRSEAERAICGGGRYDDLLGKLGKSKEPAVGFGMGDVVLSLILKDKGLLEKRSGRDSVYVAAAQEGLREILLNTVSRLRRAGIVAEFSYAEQPLPKQLKAADKSGASHVVIIDDKSVGNGSAQIKNMKTGESSPVALNDLLAEPSRYLRNQP